MDGWLTGWLAGWWPQGPEFQDRGVTQNLHGLWQVFGKICLAPGRPCGTLFVLHYDAPVSPCFFMALWRLCVTLIFFFDVSSPPWQRLGLPNDAQGPTTCFITYFGLLCSNITCFIAVLSKKGPKNDFFYTPDKSPQGFQGLFITFLSLTKHNQNIPCFIVISARSKSTSFTVENWLFYTPDKSPQGFHSFL